MNTTSERGNIQIVGLATVAVLMISTVMILYMTHQQMLRYQRGPKAVSQRDLRETQRPYPPAAVPRLPSYSLSGPLENRTVLYKELPDYPTWAEEQGVSGRVKLAFRVNPAGEVYPNVWVTQTIGYPEVDEAAVQALKHWKFSPEEMNEEAQTVAEAVIADPIREGSPGEPGIINFNFTLTSKPMRL